MSSFGKASFCVSRKRKQQRLKKKRENAVVAAKKEKHEDRLRKSEAKRKLIEGEIDRIESVARSGERSDGVEEPQEGNVVLRAENADGTLSIVTIS
ncbi:MAG: hypothetical protein SGCHY_001850 [Lobulomycetales sp.]